MGINLNLDYTSLFSSLSGSTGSSSAGSTTSNFLADYASIKNGSYGKLLKSYYSKNEFDKSSVLGSSTASSKQTAKELAAVKTDAKEVQESADALTEKGSKSLFKTDDREKILKAVKSLAEDYNSLLDSSGDTDSKNILRAAKNLTTMTKGYSNLLSNVGIEIGTNNKLTVDEDTFKKADFNTIKSLFNGNNSFAYNVSARASMIGYSAESEASKGSTYTNVGGYNNRSSSGSLFDSYL